MKAQLRSYYLNLRLALNDDYILQATSHILRRIRQHPLYQIANHVGLYHPIKKEVNLLNLMKDNKKFYLPKVSGDNLLYLPFVPSTNLVLSPLQIYEPDAHQDQSHVLDLILAPALCVDEHKHRLGYGKGFFDRFMLKHRHIKVIAIVFREQKSLKPLPVSQEDIQVDDIISN
jgi:5-formyltetrahydrofolate cyclo-ligase